MTEIAETPQTGESYAGFWVRFFAAVIDLIAYLPLYVALKFASDRLFPHLSPSDNTVDYFSQILPSTAYEWWFEGIFDIICLLSYSWFLASRWQGSPGMHLFKIYICDREGKRISFRRGLYWCVTAVLAWVVVFAGVLYLEKDIFIVTDMLASCHEQNIDEGDCITEIEKTIGIPFMNFQQLTLAAGGLALFLYIIWALSIAIPKDKTGFHNLICGTRFLRGRPQADSRLPDEQVAGLAAKQ